MQTHKFLVTVQLPDNSDRKPEDVGTLIANRAWTLDGVEHAEAQVYEAPIMFPLDKLIAQFNELYNLPSYDVPIIPHSHPAELDHHLEKFFNIMTEELYEVEAIRSLLRRDDPGRNIDKLDVLTELADWFGDITVYAVSEMRKFGIPPELVLGIIMASNMSKLGADGKPIIDERGKVLKGPNYWKPEPQIRRALEALQRQALAAQDMGN